MSNKRTRLPRRKSLEEFSGEAEEEKARYLRKLADEETVIQGYYASRFAESRQEGLEILRATRDMTDLEGGLRSAIRENHLALLRFFLRPTVSKDDFKNRIGTQAIEDLVSDEVFPGVLDFFKRNLNHEIMPWLNGGGTPAKAEERDACALAVAALAADQKAKTRRRTMKSRNQETAVKDVLRDACGMKEGPSREIKTIVDFPERGVFFDKETTVAGQKADVVAMLHDGRLLCLDCKVSSTETNSYKRLCHEVTDKAAKWREAFGQTSVTGAVLAGCFKPGNLLEAQEAGVHVFWSDALSPLVEFVNSTKECNDGQ